MQAQQNQQLEVIRKFNPQVYSLDGRISVLDELPVIFQTCEDGSAFNAWEKYRTFRSMSFPLALGGSAIVGVQVGTLISGNRMDVNWVGAGVLLGFAGYIFKLAANTHLYRSISYYNSRCVPIQGSLPPDIRIPHQGLFYITIPLGY